MFFKKSVLPGFILTILALVLAVVLSPDPVWAVQSNKWIYQDEFNRISYTITVEPAYTSPTQSNPAKITVDATSLDENEIVCLFKAGLGDVFQDSGSTWGTAGSPTATLTAYATAPGWYSVGSKATDFYGNSVTAGMSFQLPIEEGGGGGSTSFDLTGTTVIPAASGKNAVTDWTLNLKPSQDISVQAGDKITLQADGAMFHAVSGISCLTGNITGLKLAAQCLYTDGKPDTVEISFANTVPITIPASGVALKISDVVNPTSTLSSAYTTIPIVKLTTSEYSGQINAPKLTFTDSKLTLVLSADSVNVNADGEVLDGILTATATLTDNAGNLLDVNKTLEIRVKNTLATYLNGVGGSNGVDYFSLSGGQGTYYISNIKDNDIQAGSFTSTIEARLADNPLMKAEAELTVNYVNNYKITGKIIDENSKQPVPGARIDVIDSEGTICAVYYAGEDGSFEALAKSGGSGNLTITKDDYVDAREYYYEQNFTGGTYSIGSIELEHYAFKADISYGYSAATTTGPATPVTPDNYYGPYNGTPYLKKGNIKLYPKKVSGSTCYYQQGHGIAPGDTVEVVMQLINSQVIKTLPLTIGTSYDAVNKLQFVDTEKGYTVIMADEDPPDGQSGSVAGAVYRGNSREVKFELAPGQVFTYGKRPSELEENGIYYVVVMSREIGPFLGSSMNDLAEYGLAEGVDYQKYTITIADGTIVAQSVSAPANEKVAVLDSIGTTVYAKPEYSSPLTPFVVKYALKDTGFTVTHRKIIVDLPEGMDFTDECGVYNTDDRSFEVDYAYDAAKKQLTIEAIHAYLYYLYSFVFTVQVNAQSTEPLTAKFEYDVDGNGIKTQEFIGSAEAIVRQISLYGPSSTGTTTIILRGTAPSQAQVTIYDGATSIGEATASKAGSFEKTVTLNGDSSGSIHYLTAKSITGPEEQVSSVLEIEYQPLLPKITRLLYQTPVFGPVELIGPDAPAKLAIQWDADNIMNFTVETSDDSKINKMWVVISNGDAYNSGGQPMIVPALYDATQKQWLTGTVHGSLNNFKPGPITIQFTMNNYVPDPIEMLTLPADYFEDPYQYMETTEEEYLDSMPMEMKNATVNITNSSSSNITADITLADEAQSQLSYTISIGSPPLSAKAGGVTEAELDELGFHKWAMENGGKVYLRQTVNGEEIDDFIANDTLSSLASGSAVNVVNTYCIIKDGNTVSFTGDSALAHDGGVYFTLSDGKQVYYPPQEGQHYSYTGQSAGALGETLYYKASARQSDGTYSEQWYKYNGVFNGWETVDAENMPKDFDKYNVAVADSELDGYGANWSVASKGQSDTGSNVSEVIQTTVTQTTDTINNFIETNCYNSASIPGTVISIATAGMTNKELYQYMKLQIETMESMKNRKTNTGSLCYELLSENEKTNFDNTLKNMQDRFVEYEKFSTQYAAYNSLQAGSISAAAAPAIGTALGVGSAIPVVNVGVATLTAGLTITGSLYNCIVGNNQLDSYRQSAEEFAALNNAWAKHFYLMCGNVNTTNTSTNTTIKIDPSGYAYEGMPSNTIAGVRAELWLADDNKGTNACLWAEAADYDEINPQFTTAAGWYQWDVPSGWWQVRLSKDGYYNSQSEWLPVPPPQLGVNLAMVSKTTPAATITFDRDAMKWEIAFNKPMKIDTVTAALSMSEGKETVNNSIDIDITALNPENELAMVFEVSPQNGALTPGSTYTLTLAATAQSYLDTALTQTYTSTVSDDQYVPWSGSGSFNEVPVDKVWTIKFNRRLDTSTITDSRIIVYDQSFNTVDTKVDMGNDGQSALVSPPAGGYQPGRTYTMYIRGIKSAAGTSLKNYYKVQFTVVD